MANVLPLQGSFKQMIRDISRDRLPANACWNLVDWLPDLDAPLTKRGGWSYASNDISSSSAAAASATYVAAGGYAPFTAASKNCAVDEDGLFYTIAADGTVTYVGALGNTSPPRSPFTFHRNLLIIPDRDGTASPKSYDGTTLGALAGSPPNAVHAAVYKDRTVLARTDTLRNRVYFSAAGVPTTWDTTNGWVDVSQPVTGLAALRNALLVFSDGRVERIRGASPPPGSDMILETLFEPGCVDARSVVVIDDTVIFANAIGLFMTDGATVLDLTKAGGMQRYWRDMMASYAWSTWSIAGGRHRRKYLLSVMNGATFIDAFLIDPESRQWLRLSNLKSLMFWDSVGTAGETYAACRATDRVLSMSSMWSPAAGVKNDADSTAVTPVLETAFFKPKLGKLAWKRGYMTYDIRDAATDNPLLTISYVTTPESTSYTTVKQLDGTTSDTFAETSAYTYARRFLNVSAEGLGLKVAQTNASSVTKLYGLGAEVHAREASRV